MSKRHNVSTSQNMNNELPGLIDQFLEYLEIEKNCSKLTIRDYRHYLEVFSNWLSPARNASASVAGGSSRSIENLTLADVRKYRVFLANQADDKGQTRMRVTQNYYVIALRSFLRFLIKNDFKTLEPSKIDLPKTESRNLKFLTREMVDRLVTAPDTSKEEGLRDRAIMELLFSTGLRVSELVSLNKDKIDLDRREFGVIGKGSKLRLVFISDRASEWIQRYLDEKNTGQDFKMTMDNIKKLFCKNIISVLRDSLIETLSAPNNNPRNIATLVDSIIYGNGSFRLLENAIIVDDKKVIEALAFERSQTERDNQHATGQFLFSPLGELTVAQLAEIIEVKQGRIFGNVLLARFITDLIKNINGGWCGPKGAPALLTTFDELIKNPGAYDIYLLTYKGEINLETGARTVTLSRSVNINKRLTSGEVGKKIEEKAQEDVRQLRGAFDALDKIVKKIREGLEKNQLQKKYEDIVKAQDGLIGEGGLQSRIKAKAEAVQAEMERQKRTIKPKKCS